MITAKEANKNTLDSWRILIKKLIDEAIQKQKYSTAGIMNLPDIIRKELISLGYIINDNENTINHSYISWKNE